MNLTSMRKLHRILHRLQSPLHQLTGNSLSADGWWSCSPYSWNEEYLLMTCIVSNYQMIYHGDIIFVATDTQCQWLTVNGLN